MSASLRPFALFPTFHQRPWGVPSLAPWFEAPTGQLTGEAWFTARNNPTSLGPSLGEVIDANPADVLGTGAFPGNEALLLKFLFTAQRLSVQVHPDDVYARTHHSSAGKTEAWHVLRAESPAELGLGFTRRLDRDEATDAARSGAIENLIAWRTAAAGESFLVPAGTVHAIGAGLTLVEVQEPSDVTYRLYDYGRPRELHLDRGFVVADTGPYEVSTPRTSLAPGRDLLVQCTHFVIERVALRGSRRFATPTPFYHLLVAIEGTGTIAGQAFRPGSVFLAPAACAAFDVVSESAVFVVTYTANATTPALG